MASVSGMVEAVWRWAGAWREAPGPVRLNVSVDDRRGASVMTGSAETVTEYIDGTRARRMTYTCALVEPWSDGTGEANNDAMREAERWLAWCDERAMAHEWPEAPDGLEVTGCGVDDEAPRLAMVYPDGRLARYEFVCHVDFEG